MVLRECRVSGVGGVATGFHAPPLSGGLLPSHAFSQRCGPRREKHARKKWLARDVRRALERRRATEGRGSGARSGTAAEIAKLKGERAARTSRIDGPRNKVLLGA
jgi:hypothetical protein